ncbi:hypothetical protein ACJIZ3_012273 [Penstemon smallii]|uniref:Cyclin-like domain-containing protein n=1 Tax=Penstemon smallii TaxID=265156 RepID=A0ABD3UN40_9LAMI
MAKEPSHPGSHRGNNRDNPEEGGGRWYFSRKEIAEDSPSRQDGIDLKKENYLRKSYCTFLQDLGMKLKVPQVTIATAMIFCHRFFLRQSHAKNDRRTIATVCMFLAGKVEETPRPLKDVILVSYEIIHRKDVAAVQRIKQKDVYEQQKELILLGERVVLATLGFDFNVHHPYKPLVEAIKKFKDDQNTLAQVAWNFVNDGLRTSLCLQFKPHHIAAGAIFLAAKFLKVKLPSDGDKVWWQEFDVTPRQLEEVSNQMLELYEQNRLPPSQANEAEVSAAGSQPPPSKGSSHSGGISKALPSKSAPSIVAQSQANDNANSETKSIVDPKGDNALPPKDDQERNVEQIETGDTVEQKDKYHGRHLFHVDNTVGRSPQDAATKKIDKEKLKAAFERRKARGDITRKMDPVDELERELEDVQLPNENKSFDGPELKNSDHIDGDEAGDGHHQATKEQSPNNDFEMVEEGEKELVDDARMEIE